MTTKTAAMSTLPTNGLGPAEGTIAPARVQLTWRRTALVMILSLAALVAPLARPAAATLFLTGNYIQLPIDTSSEPGRFMADGNASGAKYNPAGTGGASGQDFWVWGTPVYNYTIAINGSGFATDGIGWAATPTVTDTSGGSTHGAKISGQPFAGLTFARVVTFGDNDQFITITDTLTNTSGSPLSQVATLDNTDPDQDHTTTFATSNDVVNVQVANDLAVATGPTTGLSLAFGSPSAMRVVDCSGFDNTNPYTIIAGPSDPNGAIDDIGLDLAINYGTLADGTSQSVTWYMVFAPSKAAAISTYAQATGCGDGIVGLGEQCDDGNTTAGDGCSPACQTEPCYTCSGSPSTCTTLPAGTSCDDGLFCNGTDTCSAAGCTIHTGDPCVSGAECDNVCNELSDSCVAPFGTPCTDDGNACTDDECDGFGSCTHPDNFGPCDDGIFCNGQDFCSNGSCSFHDGDPCSFNECASTCDEIAAACDPDAAGTPCFDDGNACTLDQCDGAGGCAHPPGPSGVPCPDDGNVCTADQCDGAGACAHPPGPSGVSCPDDGNVCTTDQCDGAGACAHLPGPSGIPCPDDGSPCTNDQCDAMGVCAHPPVPSGTECPDDGNDCTNDLCDGAGACAHPAIPDGTACDDDNACTQTDSCHSGICVGSDPVVCASVPCRGPSTCDHTTGTCTNCPTGYVQGDGGCQKTYAIGAILLDSLPNFCGSGNDRFQCNAPFGFHWTDTGDASVGAATHVDVQLETGLDCTNQQHDVTLNTTPIGVYTATSAACTCFPSPPVVPHVLTDSDASTYVKGGLNAVSIDTNGCAGLSPDMNSHYAIVTVTFADPGEMVVMQSGCRQAEKSRLKYKNSTTDARDKVQWKWGHGATTVQADFGDPTTSANYQFCVFAETGSSPTLLIGAEVPSSASAWSPIGTVGYKYLDKTASQDGISEILVRGGAAGRAKIILRGKGAGLSDPALPLAPADGIRVQLTNESTGICWESEFPLSAIGGSINASAP
jgi:cysteine-rich repeat protein